MYSKIKELLASEMAKGSVLKYYPNTGNAGDSLINVGFYQLAEEIGLKYELIKKEDSKNIVSGDVVIIGGGGALVPEWDATPKFIEEIVGRCKIVILPQSIRGVNELLLSLGEDDVVFCRENYSYEGCKLLNLKCAVYKGHDMAFNVSVENLDISSRERPPLSFKNGLRWAAYFYHYIVRSNFSKGISAFRCDKEANEGVLVKRRKINDFSAVARFGNASVANANYSAHMFLNLIGMYEDIVTDRLHVVVGASLMDKRVKAYPNSYFKLQGVIEQSLKENTKVVMINNASR